MKRIWTVESAKKVVESNKYGLKRCSAIDFLRKHNSKKEN